MSLESLGSLGFVFYTFSKDFHAYLMILNLWDFGTLTMLGPLKAPRGDFVLFWSKHKHSTVVAPSWDPEFGELCGSLM